MTMVAERHDNIYAERPAAADVVRPMQNKRPVWQVLFGDLLSAALTLAVLALLLLIVPNLIRWGIVDAVWSRDSKELCREADGACWAFLAAKYRQILFGIYPPDQQWRPMLGLFLVLVLTALSLHPAAWRRWLIAAWIATALGFVVLMAGGVFGLAPVSTAYWGGLPVTLLLAISALGIGFPVGVVLALGRRSTLPVAKYLSIGLIEIVRGLPLVSLLFMSSIMLPLMLPDGMSLDKLARACVALTIFSAAYIAEVVRGGLQAIPPGQPEAARALGLSWLQTTRLIVVPQALRSVIPPLTNTIIVMVKNTALVLVVGLFDLLSSGKAALTDPEWPSPFAETYLFIAAIYFVICFGISKYSLYLESRFGTAESR